MSEKLAKLIRTLTIAPIGAFVLVTILYLEKGESFGNITAYLLAVLYLTVLPVLAYPLQPFIPKFKDKGREGQRSLAIIMATIGYLCGIISIIFINATKMQWIIYLVYFFSGIGIAVFNKLLKIRASGHSCGIVGPIAIAVYFTGIKGLIAGVTIFALVCWSSLKMKRHTVSQLLWGSFLPLAALLLTHYLVVFRFTYFC
jgi:hypothetical protein